MLFWGEATNRRADLLLGFLQMMLKKFRTEASIWFQCGTEVCFGSNALCFGYAFDVLQLALVYSVSNYDCKNRAGNKYDER